MKISVVGRRYYQIKVAGIVCLAIVVLWCVCGIRANAAERAQQDKKAYQALEREFKDDVRQCMDDMGFSNSGITMTKVMDASGVRTYTVRIHHSYIDLHNEQSMQKIYGALENVTMKGQNVTVEYKIF